MEVLCIVNDVILSIQVNMDLVDFAAELAQIPGYFQLKQLIKRKKLQKIPMQ